jgi:CheY-like chemotaxis protein
MSRTILLADDSVTIQKVVELTFMEEDVEVVAVGSGAEAVEKLEEVSPSLVIADVHMPAPDGFELCRLVKQKRPGVPVLLLVGTFEAFDPQDVADCGAEGYLKKPFDSQELMRQVEQLLAASEPGSPAEPESEERTRVLFEAPEGRERDLLHGVDAEIDALAGVSQPPDSTKPAAAPSQHPAEAAAAEEAAADRPEAEEEESAVQVAVAASGARLSEEEVDRIARRVIELMSETTVREVAWEVIPDLAEVVIKKRLRELESQTE